MQVEVLWLFWLALISLILMLLKKVVQFLVNILQLLVIVTVCYIAYHSFGRKEENGCDGDDYIVMAHLMQPLIKSVHKSPFRKSRLIISNRSY